MFLGGAFGHYRFEAMLGPDRLRTRLTRGTASRCQPIKVQQVATVTAASFISMAAYDRDGEEFRKLHNQPFGYFEVETNYTPKGWTPE